MLRVILAAAIVAGAPVADAPGQMIKSRDEVDEIQGVGIDPRRGEEVPRDLEFTDSFGNTVRMGDLFDGDRPVLLIMAYYDCPLLCTLVLNRVQEGLNGVSWTAGDEFRVVTISFDHTNTTAMAAEKRATYFAGYSREEVPDDAWIFCTADAQNARGLCEAIGYHYRYIPETQEFSHPAALIFLTPDGVVHNYIENLEYRPRDIKLALFEAAEGKQGTIFDRVEHFCFVYDPDTGGYVLAMGVMKTGGILTMLALGSFITWVVWSSAIKRKPGEERTRAPAPSTH